MRIPYSALSARIDPETTGEKFGLYLHFPYCSKRCPYCHFYSLPYDRELVKTWLKLLAREIKESARIFNRRGIIDTVYFGGGTPSILSPEEVAGILREIKSEFNHNLVEVTLECNPEAPPERLSGWKEAGITRLSLGLQSFDDGLLRVLGRSHTAETAWRFLKKAGETGFSSINFDFMTGLPGETGLTLEINLEAIEKFKPEHVSVYILEEVESVPFRKIWEENPVSDDLVAERFETYAQGLKNLGYEHYEISNYARPGFQCLHNLKYWRYQPFLGLGPSAASHFGRTRWQNEADFKEWQAAVSQRYLQVQEFLVLEKEQVLREKIAFGLRLKEGLNWEQLKNEFNHSFLSAYERKIEELFSSGDLCSSGNRVFIPEEKFLLSTSIISRLIF